MLPTEASVLCMAATEDRKSPEPWVRKSLSFRLTLLAPLKLRDLGRSPPPAAAALPPTLLLLLLPVTALVAKLGGACCGCLPSWAAGWGLSAGSPPEAGPASVVPAPDEGAGDGRTLEDPGRAISSSRSGCARSLIWLPPSGVTLPAAATRLRPGPSRARPRLELERGGTPWPPPATGAGLPSDPRFRRSSLSLACSWCRAESALGA
jgi:hypothetical protein